MRFIDPLHQKIEGINHLIGAGKTVRLSRRAFAGLIDALDTYPRDLRWHVTIKGTSFHVEIRERPEGDGEAEAETGGDLPVPGVG